MTNNQHRNNATPQIHHTGIINNQDPNLVDPVLVLVSESFEHQWDRLQYKISHQCHSSLMCEQNPFLRYFKNG